MHGDSIDEVLDFAIGREQEAVDFYTDLAGKVKMPAMKAVFEQFAKEEQGHKARLTKIKEGKQIKTKSKGPIIDLKISDYVVDEEPTPDITYQAALILAMKKEKAAFRLYTSLAEITEDAAIKQVLLDLAQEEAKHKLRFEVEYDENILTEN